MESTTQKNPVQPVENIWGAVWKSAVTEVLAKHLNKDDPASTLDASHPLIAATDHYLNHFAEGRLLPEPEVPDGEMVNIDPAILGYLSQLHHQLGHAQVTGNKALEEELKRQLGRYKFGNPLWEQMAIQYYEYYAQYPYHKAGEPRYRSWQGEDAGKGDINYGVIQWRLPANATIAIIGDIGTGTDVAAAVLLAALSFRPDAILHVGDVYYSGTRFEFAHRFTGLFETVFASVGFRVPVFTVPGNHEYFTGAIAYLECLDSGVLALRPEQRQSASYFALRSEDDGWQFLGMDTGFHGHTMAIPVAEQQDALNILHSQNPAVPTDPSATDVVAPSSASEVVSLRDDEVAWHKDKWENFKGRSVLLSHHQLYSQVQSCGTAQRTITGPDGKPAPDPTDFNRVWIDTTFWRQLGSGFGKHVAAWFWGHEHNLGIFQNNYRPADWPEGAEATDVFRTLPVGRCVGHSAIPVAESEKPYAENHPVPLKDASLKLGVTDGWYNRGFQILNLQGAGNPCRVRYFQVVSADPTPVLIHEETIT